MQAPVRRLLPASIDITITKPCNIMEQMNKDFEEIENTNNIEFSTVTSSIRKRVPNNAKTAKGGLSLNSTKETARKECFVIYEDSTGGHSEGPVKTPSNLKPKKNVRRNTGKSSIPIASASSCSTRITRSRRT